MAKKSRKQRQKVRASQARPSEPTSGAGAERPRTSPGSSTALDLAGEYRYVFEDLRKIGIIAAAMFMLLFLLAFALR
jgi:hypothetical protein